MVTSGIKLDTRVSISEKVERLHALGKLSEAAQLLSNQMIGEETAELWNDWGVMQVGLGEFEDAEKAFRAALRLDAVYGAAAENLGALLFSLGRKEEAGPLLRLAMRMTNEEHRAKLSGLLEKCPLTDAGESEKSFIRKPLPRQIHNPEAETKNGPHSGENKKSKATYDEWFESVFKKQIAAPGVRIGVSWPEDSPWGRRAFSSLLQVECEYAKELLFELKANNVPGDIAEFGIFEGWWIRFLDETTESIGFPKRVYGFDSFEGLSDPHPTFDTANWEKGQYSCSYEQVAKNIGLIGRPRVKLVKGFFEKSLHGADARLVNKFCYVRIDCDIYQPALDCLQYLGPRLADGAILVFDDWPHVRGFGEQLAFEEWLPTVPNLEFEFLFYGVIGHFYLRVHHRK